MTKQLIAALLLSATALAVQPASAADIPVKAAPPVAVVAPGGFFFSVTGGYFFDDPNKDIFISPNNGGGGVPPPNCCGAGLGDGWGGRGLVGYRWSLFDVAVAYERANFSRAIRSDPTPRWRRPFMRRMDAIGPSTARSA